MAMKVMTNRRDFPHTSPLMVAGSAVAGNTVKRPEAAIHDETGTDGFVEQVRINQQKLTAELKPHYDFIVCGISLRAVNHDYFLLCGGYGKSTDVTGQRSAIDNR